MDVDNLRMWNSPFSNVELTTMWQSETWQIGEMDELEQS
jgi:hypothetical protein